MKVAHKYGESNDSVEVYDTNQQKAEGSVISPSGIKEIDSMLRKLRINGYKETTLRAYKKAMVQFYKVTELETINDVTMEDIDRYKEYMMVNKYRSAGRRLEAVKTYLRRMGKEDLAYKVHNIKTDREIPDILTENEVDKLYDTARTYESKRYGKPLQALYTAIVSILYYSGLRRFEMCNLTMKDVNFKGGVLKVKKGKGGNGALVPISEQCLKDIKEYMKYRPPVKSDKLLISTMGRPINSDVVTRIIKKLSAMANIDKDVTAHTLRYTMATHLIENGANQYTVKNILRHSKLTTTDLYVNLSPKFLQESYKDHIKPTMGKEKISKGDKRKRTLEELNNLLMKGKISEETYLTIRSDMMRAGTSTDYGQAYV
ncbi:MAG: tyrosine-type recombinase/integrase [Candidatus Thermoplasmatota archaeon]|nr:tyrosine-type recombinase/integrase [Candidatus Thermoplasmatota archaeon]